jgi:predicted component of type VI protein secretion system
MCVFNNRKMLMLAAVLMLGFAGCDTGRTMSTLEGYVQSAKAALPGLSSVQLSPEEQELFDRMSPEQQASFLRVMNAFRQMKAQRAEEVERATTAELHDFYADSTEESVRKKLLKDPDTTLGYH